jgi:ABC-type sugar transport system ATPase subunit
MDPLLRVEHLTTVFDTRRGPLAAVDDVSFEIRAGETLGLVGESGSGKSMTALSIMRLVQPPGRIAAGSIVFNGQDLRTLPERDMRGVRGAGIGFVFQEPMTALNPVFTIGDQIGETLRVHGRASRRDARAKVVASVHLALTGDTRGFVGRSVLEKLKPGAYFINTARGEVVDHEALAAAIRDRGVRAGLDVFAAEPKEGTGAFTDPIAALPNVVGTHHIGASTDQAQEAIAAETVRIVAAYKDTGRVPNVVNLAKKTPATHMLVVRHLDRPGVLAHVFQQLRASNVNVQETENIIFEGAKAAVARINLDAAPSPAVLEQIQSGNADVLDLHVVSI